MKKILMGILIVILVIIGIFVLIAIAGTLSTVRPNEQIEKAKCMKSCQEGALSDNCTQYCIDQLAK